MPQPTEADPQAWRRWLAMQANNRGWDLSVQERTAAEDREMLDAAHASAWLWAPIGTELNRMRATMLLAEVTALVGDTSRALVLASETRAYFLSHETPDWEIALTHVITAHCAAKAGERELHREAFESAIAAIAKIAEAEDRAIVEKTFAHVPVP